MNGGVFGDTIRWVGWRVGKKKGRAQEAVQVAYRMNRFMNDGSWFCDLYNNTCNPAKELPPYDDSDANTRYLMSTKTTRVRDINHAYSSLSSLDIIPTVSTFTKAASTYLFIVHILMN